MKVFFKTFGCQMNKSDSERMLALLEREGYQLCASVEEADLAIANTCSIRAKAEDKLFSLLGEWKAVKRKREKSLFIAVVGCIAQQE
ncbi:MAG TPA: tRNA (N6-isopentenyl adenosine(37)-C2)-methylthiotransferase MiaB, partial [Chroococcales cyanobacterium]